jgi:hypothetical protein
VELYDHDLDPLEMQNLADREGLAPIKQSLAAQLSR